MLTFRAIVLVLLMASPTPALANGGEPTPEPPGVMRLLTFEDATSTSDCIGNPATPLCAAETNEACYVRHEPALCAVIGKDGSFLAGETTESRRNRYAHYKIIGIEELIDATIPSYGRTPPGHETDPALVWRPGDVKVELQWMYCTFDVGCSIWDIHPKTYIVRHSGHTWHVVIRDSLRW